jgi:signal transduction histidine kinase/CHASE3 domain sensor protein/ActR/RegA family two-component response regulator
VRERDLSLGQRLVIGFGALVLLLGSLIAVAFLLLAESNDVQADFTTEVLPRLERARALETSILNAGIAVRAYMVAPTPDRLRRHEESARRVDEALRALGRAASDPESVERFAQIELLVSRYLTAKARLLEASREAPVTPAQEASLSELREQVVAVVHALVTQQEGLTDEAMGSLAANRSYVRRALLVAALAAMLGVLIIGWAITTAVRGPVLELVGVAGALARGDWKPALQLAPVAARGQASSSEPRDEMRQLARAFGAAAVALEQRQARLVADGQLANATTVSLDRADIAARALGVIAAHAGAEVAAVYWRDVETGRLAPLATHALASRLEPLAMGEGIPGQAAADRRTLVVRDIPGDSAFAISIGYDAAPPRTVAAVPVSFGTDLLGTLVVGTLRDLDADAIAFLESAAAQLGTGLQNALSHERIERLLGQLRETNRRLQAQGELLQEQNEALQAQSEEIQAQSEEIQAQNEEIQAQSEEIQTQNEELETQSEELRGRNAVLERLTHDLETRAARLAEADAQKNAFLGMLAHELRNPMAAMTVSLQLLHRVPPDSDRGLRARAVIDRQVQHMTRLIDDLLDVTRISRGKVSLRSEPVDLVQIVRSCEDDAHASFEARGLVLQVETPDAPVWVQGDRTRLCQVVNNLLHNAGKFTREGGRVRLQLTVGPDGEAMIRVTDTGTGIDPQLLPRLFQPFSQGSTTLARTGGGLGLGLALVKALVDLHGGRVEAHSDGPGRGATFTVHLPLQDAVRPAHRARPTAVATRRWRILLVEDNSDAAWSLGEALALDGHDVEVATSGEEAIDKARLAKPELVLCDIGLPAMDGYEIARRFRADAELKGTLLVALTGYASETDRSQATAAGFDGHLAKPLRMDELAQVLAEFEVAGGTA